jgi:hypothetical protein
MRQALSRKLLIAEACIQYQGSQCGICGGNTDNETGFSASTSVFPRQYNSTEAAYSFIHYHRRCVLLAINSLNNTLIL